MDKTFRFKSTSIQVYHDRISIKQMFLSEDFKKMDIMDIRQEKNMLYIQTRRNQFKIKIPKGQAQEADALFQYLTDQKEESQTIENVKVNYLGGHPQMPEEGWAELDIRNDRLLLSTFQRTAQIDYKNIRTLRYENEVQIVRRLPKERLSLLSTLAVRLRSCPNASKYYFTIYFTNALGDLFCVVLGGKQAKHAYDIVVSACRKSHGIMDTKKTGDVKPMNNFTYYIPTRIHFGKGMISHLSEITQKNILLVYGGGSIKRNGIYDAALKELSGHEIFELPGVEPNPRIETVRKGVQICQDNQIEAVLAIGGGSSIDCAKVIAAAAVYEGDAWDLVMDNDKIQSALPIYVVLTMAATGSEMDNVGVISDMDLQIKKGVHSDHIFPTMSILDPTYTYTLPKRQTAAGTADIMSHTFENYFTNVEGAYLQARFAEGLLKTLIHYGPIAIKDPTNYDARANLMWCSSNAINGLLKKGAEVKWCVHGMEHQLSAVYDVTHGEGLAILTPVWMEYILDQKVDAFATYGINVWNIDAKIDKRTIAKEAIEKTKHFLFDELGCPRTLREVGITDEKNFKAMAEKAVCKGSFVDLSVEDIIEIYRRAL